MLQLRNESRIHHSGAQQFRRFDPIHRRRDRIRVEGGNRKAIAEAIAPANYLNAPPIVLEQVLTGTYADGLGNVKTDPKRVDFDPFPGNHSRCG